MIDFQIRDRRSGKTTEIIEMYKKNGGVIVFPTFSCSRNYSKAFNIPYMDHTNSFDFKLIIHNYFNENKNLYFDEFLFQDRISYEDLIKLDKKGYDITIRTSIYSQQQIPDYFTEYIKEKYPEYYI